MSEILEISILQDAGLFSKSRSKILDFLIMFREFDYSISDISKYSKVSFKTTLKEINELEDLGIIKKTRNVGKAILYRFNVESNLGLSIYNFVMDSAKQRLRVNMESNEMKSQQQRFSNTLLMNKFKKKNKIDNFSSILNYFDNDDTRKILRFLQEHNKSTSEELSIDLNLQLNIVDHYLDNLQNYNIITKHIDSNDNIYYSINPEGLNNHIKKIQTRLHESIGKNLDDILNEPEVSINNNIYGDVTK